MEGKGYDEMLGCRVLGSCGAGMDSGLCVRSQSQCPNIVLRGGSQGEGKGRGGGRN